MTGDSKEQHYTSTPSSSHRDSSSTPFQDKTLAEQDPEVYSILQHEQSRQYTGLELIASENFTSRAVLEILGTAFTNKYSEGLPGKRYYGGNEFIDEIENLAIKRALEAFNLSSSEWGCNVQPYSGSPANFAVYTALLQPHERIMGLDLPSGGHLTHGYYTPKKKISATSIYFESLPYRVNSTTGYVDYKELENQALVYRPRIIICGASAYPREWDYKQLRGIADKVGAFLMCDMAHYAGLVAAKCLNSPFEYAHVVTTTTHKSLRGPRAGMIFFRKTPELNFEERINFAVFPSLQGGPHNNTIAGIAVAMAEVATPAFQLYGQQVIKNSKALAAALMSKGHKLATDGTDNHLILWDLRGHDMTGNKYELVCDACSITLNKNAIHGDVSAFAPGGVRIGTPALTSRGFKENDFIQVAEYLDRALTIAKNIQQQSGKPLAEFKKILESGKNNDIVELRNEVQRFASQFYMCGFNHLVNAKA